MIYRNPDRNVRVFCFRVHLGISPSGQIADLYTVSLVATFILLPAATIDFYTTGATIKTREKRIENPLLLMDNIQELDTLLTSLEYQPYRRAYRLLMSATEIEKLRTLDQLTEGDYEAFLYDCDGTLADNMMAHKQAYKEVAATYGIDLDISIIDETAGWPTVLVAKELSRRYKVELPETFATEKSAVFINKYIENTQPVVFVFEHLKKNVGRVKIGVVSGGSRSTVSKTLSVLGLTDCIDVLVCAGETQKGKPAPDPFLKAAQDLGVAPSKCMVFEDGEPGTKSAEAAGMKWIRVDKI